MKGSKSAISVLLSIVMLISLFSGIGVITVSAKEAVYNFSELTDGEYATKNASVQVFGGDIILSASEVSKPVSVNFTTTEPDGSTMNFTSALKAKGMILTLTLEAGEKAVVFYRGTSSDGTSIKSLDMSVVDTATSTTILTETNSEKEAKPYVLSFTSENGGTYQIGDAVSSNRTLVYAVVITKNSVYDPTISGGGSEIPTSTEEPTSTPEPKETVDPNTVSEIQIISAKGLLNSAVLKWTNSAAVDKYNVYYKAENATEYTKIDDELIRYYGSYYRADVVGLSAGNYTFKVAAVIANVEKDAKETNIVTVQTHDREGFAFDSRSPYYDETGLGGYKFDGTLRDKAQVVYVDNTNKNSVKHTVMVKGKANEATGLAEILKFRAKGDAETTPLVIRLIGKIEPMNGLNSNGYLEIKDCSNITIEGIGNDAVVYGWGILMKATERVEVNNLGLMEFVDDGVSLDGSNFNSWVHNCDFFYGQPGSDSDQFKGDGSLDIKADSSWATFSYNHFYDSGKMSLCGLNETGEYFVTYHHNWFDHSDSRHPRVRVGTVHIYNNYYDGIAKYGAGATMASNLFVESNYFRNVNRPVSISMQGRDSGTFSGEDGGMIKMYGNTLDDCGEVINAKDNATDFDAYIADARDEKVPDTYKTKKGGTTYNNFDTNENMYKYVADNSADVPTIVEAYAGRVEGGDFEFEFDDAKDDSRYDLNVELDTLIANYKTSLVTSYTADRNYPSTSGTVQPEPTETVIPIPTETPKPITPTESIYSYVISSAEFVDNSLEVDLQYIGSETNPTAKLIVAAFNENGVITDTVYMFDINGTTVNNLSYTKPQNAKTVRVYIWDSLEAAKPICESKTVVTK